MIAPADVVTLSVGVLDHARITALQTGIESATSARAVVLTGKPNDWLGVELGVEEAHAGLPGLLATIDRAPMLVIARVEGRALGGGVALAAVCDLVIAGERASFGLSEGLFGLPPAIVFPYVARRVGVARARALALTARSVTAAEGMTIGLVDEVARDLDDALARVVVRACRLDRRAVAAMKSLVATHHAPAAAYLQDANERFASLLASEPTRARIQRFRDGLAPWDDPKGSPSE